MEKKDYELTEADLLSCPFCGSAACIYDRVTMTEEGLQRGFIVHCSNITCIGYHCRASYDIVLEAVRAWNSRIRPFLDPPI